MKEMQHVLNFHRQIPTVNRSKTAGKQHIQKSFDKLTKQLDNLTNEKNHWKTYDTVSI